MWKVLNLLNKLCQPRKICFCHSWSQISPWFFASSGFCVAPNNSASPEFYASSHSFQVAIIWNTLTCIDPWEKDWVSEVISCSVDDCCGWYRFHYFNRLTVREHWLWMFWNPPLPLRAVWHIQCLFQPSWREAKKSRYVETIKAKERLCQTGASAPFICFVQVQITLGWCK